MSPGFVLKSAFRELYCRKVSEMAGERFKITSHLICIIQLERLVPPSTKASTWRIAPVQFQPTCVVVETRRSSLKIILSRFTNGLIHPTSPAHSVTFSTISFCYLSIVNSRQKWKENLSRNNKAENVSLPNALVWVCASRTLLFQIPEGYVLLFSSLSFFFNM